MHSIEIKNFDKADETRTFEGNGWADIVSVGGRPVARGHFEPGWRWSRNVKPIAGTDLCEAPHMQYQVSGRIHVLMADGTEFEAGPGDVVSMPQGHDAWVVGDEPVVVVDWYGASNYAR